MQTCTTSAPSRVEAQPASVHGTLHSVRAGQGSPLTTALVRTLTAPLRWLLPTHECVAPEMYDRCPCEYDEQDEPSLVDCARYALEAERGTDMADLLAEFGIDVERLRLLASAEEARLITDQADRHPISYLYAHRVAQLAGVTLADDDEARFKYERAREWCERLVGLQGQTSFT